MRPTVKGEGFYMEGAGRKAGRGRQLVLLEIQRREPAAKEDLTEWIAHCQRGLLRSLEERGALDRCPAELAEWREA